MRIHILRHAEAEESSETGRDADRRLTDAGRKRMREVARAFATLEPALSAILVSPLVRARETAEPVARAVGFDGPLRVTDALLPGADPEAILGELRESGEASVLLVGHMPQLGRLLGRLLSGRRSGLEVPMKKGSLAVLETGDDPAASPAELRLFATARLLARLGEP